MGLGFAIVAVGVVRRSSRAREEARGVVGRIQRLAVMMMAA
jgi:hypothetical protein